MIYEFWDDAEKGKNEAKTASFGSSAVSIGFLLLHQTLQVFKKMLNGKESKPMSSFRFEFSFPSNEV
jgi:hypothetical protein